MGKRGSAVHVATTRRKYKGKVYEAHLLRRTYREGKKVKHETVGNLSHLPEHVIELIRRALKGESFVSAEESFECVRSLPHGHVCAVLGVLKKLELDKIISSRRSRERDLAVTMVVDRVIHAGTKLATARGLDQATASSTLGEVLDVVSASEDELYGAMDWLLERQNRIETKLARRHLADGSLVLYDVTSSYLEGRTCPLARLGHNRDGKKGKLQIVIGLLCTREGCPVAVEVFDGNTGDPSTLTQQVTKIRDRFGLSRVILVGDRGMITSARIREDLEPLEGISWITALRAPAIRALLNSGELQLSLFDDRDLAEITSEDYPGERLIVCLNPLLAAERARKRDELLEATEAELEKIAVATRREKRPLRGADQIGLRIGKVRNKYKVGKHFDLEISDESFTYRRKTEQIREEALLDGLYVIRTSVPTEELETEEAVKVYKSLSVVERAFRSMKTVDLKIRPIHHRLAPRVRSHVFICMLAYYVEWHMRQALAPMLFDDHQREQADAERESIVAPAKRSKAAQEKLASMKTPDGDPVHSFRTLLDDLATIVRNTVRPTGTSLQPFQMTTTPTSIQRKALDRLGVSLSL